MKGDLGVCVVMRFETISLQKIRFMRAEGPNGLCTAWHTGFDCVIKKAMELGIDHKNHINSPVVDVILKNGEDWYLNHGTAGTAEVGGKNYIMLEVVDDYLIIEGVVYVRSYDQFSIDPIEKDDD